MESDLSPSPTTTDEQREADEVDPAAARIRPPPRSRRPQSSQLEWVLAAEDEAPSRPRRWRRACAPAEAPAAAPVAATVAKVEAAAPATSEKRRRRSRISRLAGTPRKVVRVLLGGKKHH